MTSEILTCQFEFLLEADKLRGVDRANLILDCSRVENAAEHSWHLALYALVLAPHAPADVDITRVIKMLLLHDIVEIDVGDHPIHEETDWAAVELAEQQAARRLFGLLPAAQQQDLLALWSEFEANQTPDAVFAKALDRSQPIFQTLCGAAPRAAHVAIVRDNLNGGRAASLETSFPALFDLALHKLYGLDEEPDTDLSRQLRFLNECDELKQVQRATCIGDGSRRENSAEHSWHVLLYAWILSDHASATVSLPRVLQMLLLHDIVEIDAGDAPIHGQVDHLAMAEKEAQAADRLFGLLPESQGQTLRAIWDEFEAAESKDAIFAKAIDRVQPVLLNLITGGGSWIEYDVSLEQVDTRVGAKVTKGAPDVWSFVRSRIAPWFAARNQLSKSKNYKSRE